mgnify:CR=1 FL=1
MIKAVVFVDDTLNQYYRIYKALEKIMSSKCMLEYIDAKYGYSSNQEDIDTVLRCDYDAIVITNSLIVFNDSRLKVAVSENMVLKNYYIVDRENYELKSVDELTHKEVRVTHNLESMYINNAFENNNKGGINND